MNLDKFISRHEGYSSEIYLCTGGVHTGGRGHAFHVGSTLPKRIWENIFQEDVFRVFDEFLNLQSRHNWTMTTARAHVVCDMLFALGLTRFLKFGRFLGALADQDWQSAHDEILDSDWHRELLKRKASRGWITLRTEELANIMLVGTDDHLEG